MKVILLIAMVALAAATPTLKEQWTSFKKQHGKSYNSIEEEQLRMAIFSEKQRMIEEHNAKYEAGLSTYYLGMNRFGDMLPGEETRLESNRTESMWQVPSLPFIPPANVRVPNSIDWRQFGAVTPVKNQGNCGSCWAFSSTGVLEGQLFRTTGRLVSLSEQHLMDCTVGFDNNSCKSGLMDNSYIYLGNVAGLESEDSYPYEAQDRVCRYDPNRVVPGTHVKAYFEIPQWNDRALLAAVATAGPIAVRVSAVNDHFKLYGGGVFDGYACDPSNLNHAILLVGYGTDNGEDYWLVKNSWGANWGESGYMRMTRSKINVCGISSSASYPILG